MPKTTNEIKVAILDVKFSELKEQNSTEHKAMLDAIAGVNENIDTLTNVYATKEKLAQVAVEVERRIVVLENSSNIWKWFSPIFASAISAVIVFLLIAYLKG